MKKPKNYYLIIFIPLLLLCLVFTAQAQYAVGDTVPDFTLNNLNNTPVSLYNYMGDVVLLNFFATW
jgi:cytochrome oxidase Cu insertion factor (SCO1/SenC/PrrC family)